MTEFIGNPCECIYPFEKHYITMALEHEIDTIKNGIQKLLSKE
jgi:hypothetical protein